MALKQPDQVSDCTSKKSLSIRPFAYPFSQSGPARVPRGDPGHWRGARWGQRAEKGYLPNDNERGIAPCPTHRSNPWAQVNATVRCRSDDARACSCCVRDFVWPRPHPGPKPGAMSYKARFRLHPSARRWVAALRESAGRQDTRALTAGPARPVPAGTVRMADHRPPAPRGRHGANAQAQRPKRCCRGDDRKVSRGGKGGWQWGPAATPAPMSCLPVHTRSAGTSG